MRYFIGFLVTVGLVIILIILLFNGGGKARVQHTTKTLTDYATSDSNVSMTIAGPINAVSLHRETRVTVDSSNVTFEAITGYDGQVVSTQDFANTESAYDAFLHALQHAGFTSGSNVKALQNDVGYCSTGQRYIFKLTDNGNQLQRYWASSCGGPKTYLGSLNLTLTLFQAQVPDYNSLTSKAQLN